MSEYLLTWNGAEGRILSGGFYLMTEEPFPLPFSCAALYYEPGVGNAFLVEEDGARRNLSSSENCR